MASTGEYFTVQLPPYGSELGTCIDDGGTDECIKLPSGRPIYALLVSGFHQNKQFDMFHWYNFAKCLMEKDAYVHYSWWNNLLAPYMERPLHDPNSVPSTKANPWEEVNNYTWVPPSVRKAIPGDDYQFQQDATRLIKAIRDDNEHALIILVGHSMGGDAVARLAASDELKNIEIALLAPIDPVGNRSCLPSGPASFLPNRCLGLLNFQRYQTTRVDWWWTPPQRHFDTNVKYLYYRYQKEWFPPFDYAIDHSFGYHGTQVSSIEEASELESTNVQSRISNSWLSHYDVPLWGDYLGALDGHGEIVGFRGVQLRASWDWANLLWADSYPLALKVPGKWLGLHRPPSEWPFGKCEAYESDPNTPLGKCRVEHMEKWHDDPNYLYKAGFEPYNPGLCMVSRDMCNILDSIMLDSENLPLVADAGPDQTVPADGDCIGQAVLDGSGSSDPEGEQLTYTWNWNDGGSEATGPNPVIELPLGVHEITLVVNNGQTDSEPDTVMITVVDVIPPTIESVIADPATLWPPDHSMVPVQLTIVAYDICDASPDIMLVSVTSDELDDAHGAGDGHTTGDIQDAGIGTADYNLLLRAERQGVGDGRVYTITYSATDDYGNSVASGTVVTVAHDNNEQPRPQPPKRAMKER